MTTDEPAKMSPDYKWLAAMALVLLGWGVNIGILGQQVYQNTKTLETHGTKNYHEGVRALTDANSERIGRLEVRQARIETLLEEIKRAVERLDR